MSLNRMSDLITLSMFKYLFSVFLGVCVCPSSGYFVQNTSRG